MVNLICTEDHGLVMFTMKIRCHLIESLTRTKWLVFTKITINKAGYNASPILNQQDTKSTTCTTSTPVTLPLPFPFLKVCKSRPGTSTLPDVEIMRSGDQETTTLTITIVGPYCLSAEMLAHTDHSNSTHNSGR